MKREIELAGDLAILRQDYDRELTDMFGELGVSRFWNPDDREYQIPLSFVPYGYKDLDEFLDELVEQRDYEME